MKTVRLFVILVLATAFLSVAGCSKKNRNEPITKEGIIKSIDKAKRTATVIIRDKMGRPQELEGRFTEQTVVTINGKPGQLADIKPEDTAAITVERKGQDADVDYIALRVEVTRLGEGESKPAE